MTRTLAAAGVFLCLQQTPLLICTQASLIAAAFSGARANSSALSKRLHGSAWHCARLWFAGRGGRVKSLGLWFIIS